MIRDVSAARFNAYYTQRVIGVLASWRARHPNVRVCPVLPPEAHKKTELVMSDKERRQIEAWALQYG